MPWSPSQPAAKLCRYKARVLKDMSPPKINVFHHSREGKKQTIYKLEMKTFNWMLANNCVPLLPSGRLVGTWVIWVVCSICALHAKTSGGNYPDYSSLGISMHFHGF